MSDWYSVLATLVVKFLLVKFLLTVTRPLVVVTSLPVAIPLAGGIPCCCTLITYSSYKY